MSMGWAVVMMSTGGCGGGRPSEAWGSDPGCQWAESGGGDSCRGCGDPEEEQRPCCPHCALLDTWRLLMMSHVHTSDSMML